ncbi:hypothetical protein F5141DRAFT_1071845, partial [Pisolithus sp. B1]
VDHPIFMSSPLPLTDHHSLRARYTALRIADYNSWGGPESTEKQRWLAGIIDRYPLVPYIDEMLLQIMTDEFELSLRTAARTKSRGKLLGSGWMCAAVEIPLRKSVKGKLGDMSRQQKSVRVVGTTRKIAAMTKETTVMSTWREKWGTTKPCRNCWIIQGIVRELMSLRWLYYGAPREYLKRAICRYISCQPVSRVCAPTVMSFAT